MFRLNLPPDPMAKFQHLSHACYIEKDVVCFMPPQTLSSNLCACFSLALSGVLILVEKVVQHGSSAMQSSKKQHISAPTVLGIEVNTSLFERRLGGLGMPLLDGMREGQREPYRLGREVGIYNALFKKLVKLPMVFILDRFSVYG